MLCCAVGYIYYIYFLRSSSIFKYLRSSSIVKKLRSSSIFQKIEVVFNLKKNEVVFHISSSWVETMLHTKNQLPRLPRTKLRSSSIWKKLRSSSIFKNIEVVFHNSSSWVKIRLHTENQLPGLPWSALKVSVVGWGGFHSIMWSPQLRFVLESGCDNKYISSKLSCTSVERYSTCIMHYAWHMGRTKPLEPEPWDQTLGTHPALGLGTQSSYTTLEANLGTEHWVPTQP